MTETKNIELSIQKLYLCKDMLEKLLQLAKDEKERREWEFYAKIGIISNDWTNLYTAFMLKTLKYSESEYFNQLKSFVDYIWEIELRKALAEKMKGEYCESEFWERINSNPFFREYILLEKRYKQNKNPDHQNSVGKVK